MKLEYRCGRGTSVIPRRGVEIEITLVFPPIFYFIWVNYQCSKGIKMFGRANFDETSC